MPYGVTSEGWDVKWTKEDLNLILRQIVSVNKSTNFVCVFFHAHEDSGMVQDVFASFGGFKNITNFCWLKPNQRTPTPIFQYTNAYEVATVVYYGGAKDCVNKLNPDVAERPNYVCIPAVTDKFKDKTGAVINPCQKPGELIGFFIVNHCLPESTILVVGAGGGGDVLGCLQHQQDVVAVEKDRSQFNNLYTSLMSFQLQEQAAVAKKQQEQRKQEKALAKAQPKTSESPEPSSNVSESSTSTTYTCSGCLQSITNEPLRQCFDCDIKLHFHTKCLTFEDGVDVGYCAVHQPVVPKTPPTEIDENSP
jgi:hypothetical protein